MKICGKGGDKPDEAMASAAFALASAGLYVDAIEPLTACIDARVSIGSPPSTGGEEGFRVFDAFFSFFF